MKFFPETGTTPGLALYEVPMRTQIQTDHVQTVTCSCRDTSILPGEGRYNVLPGESYCSWACLYQTSPHIAEAIVLFVRAPHPFPQVLGDTLMLRCPFCKQAVDGLTLYLAAGGFRLMVCEVCYALLVSKEHQPHSQPMQRLRRVLWGSHRKEVMVDACPSGGDAVAGHGVPALANRQAHRGAVCASVATGGRMGGPSKEVKHDGTAI